MCARVCACVCVRVCVRVTYTIWSIGECARACCNTEGVLRKHTDAFLTSPSSCNAYHTHTHGFMTSLLTVITAYISHLCSCLCYMLRGLCPCMCVCVRVCLYMKSATEKGIPHFRMGKTRKTFTAFFKRQYFFFAPAFTKLCGEMRSRPLDHRDNPAKSISIQLYHSNNCI